MKTIKSTLILLAAIIPAFFNCTSGQQKTTVPIDASHWSVNSEDYRFEAYLGVPSIYLPQGSAQLNDVVFHNGIIEFDIAFPEGRGFPGINFRIQDELNAEEFYMRPHQSGNPDANQYTPIFNGLAGWQLYYGEGHGAPIKYNYDAWNHVKLVISGTIGEVYINDMEKPLFQIFELKHGDVKGPITLKGNAKSHFANFSYTSIDPPKLKLPVKEISKLEENVISQYEVSESVEGAPLFGKVSLNPDEVNVKWTSLHAEYTGNINIARVAKIDQKLNTALVKFTITSESDQVKRLDFGFSDVVQAYVNGKLIYGGNNIFRTRDYRYLGTIGYFDSIYLDLKKGDNEILFAVTEGFGGWGVKAKVEDLKGITIPTK